MKTYTPTLDAAILDRLRDYAALFADDFPQAKPARWAGVYAVTVSPEVAGADEGDELQREGGHDRAGAGRQLPRPRGHGPDPAHASSVRFGVG